MQRNQSQYDIDCDLRQVVLVVSYDVQNVWLDVLAVRNKAENGHRQIHADHSNVRKHHRHWKSRGSLYVCLDGRESGCSTKRKQNRSKR